MKIKLKEAKDGDLLRLEAGELAVHVLDDDHHYLLFLGATHADAGRWKRLPYFAEEDEDVEVLPRLDASGAAGELALAVLTGQDPGLALMDALQEAGVMDRDVLELRRRTEECYRLREELEAVKRPLRAMAR